MDLRQILLTAFTIIFIFFQPTLRKDTLEKLDDNSSEVLRKPYNVSVTVYDRGVPTDIKRKCCTIDVQSLELNVPLMIDPDDHSEFLYPDKDGNIHFNEGESVFLSCGTDVKKNYLISFPNIFYAEFFCACGELFYGNGHSVYSLKIYWRRTKYLPAIPNTPPSDIIKALDQDAQFRSFKVVQYRIEDSYPCNLLEPAYLVSPHLMVYTAAAVAAYDYLNIVPFWKCNVSHGLFSKLLIDTVSKRKVDMYLSAKSISDLIEKKFPVHTYAFKAVIDRVGRSGVVFVTVNDIHLKLDNFVYYCENPMTEMKGARMPYHWKLKHTGYGFSYMCSVADFQRSTNIYFHEDIYEDRLLYIPTN
ncbi:hypothetical protein TSAR_002406 [Trichomalopsis sarcophagae]|uniref:Uncharacterized protein n=1 Tax=Trichomalopsis sarcophagae TaxID=543379 RepID=A0A232FMH7_9HYME|nr:hypothetical protein TSAR_002406 [Trichomalopsis sarcophagae]